MSDYKEKWGLYQWFEEHGKELVHPEDIDNFRKLIPNGKVFKCIYADDTYLTLQYGRNTYRVKPDLFKVVPEPQKNFGDTVTILKSEKVAEIFEVMWHFKRNTHMFSVKIDGEKKSKRYWIEDFKI